MSNPSYHSGSVSFTDESLRDAYFLAYEKLLSFWPTEPERRDVMTSFGRTFVLSAGPQDAPPLVLFHGIGSTSASWHPLVESLSQERRIHAVDIMGDAGGSVHNGTPISGFDQLVTWAREVLDALGASTVDLCGHSFGGHLALRVALAHPERASRLVLLDPARCFAEVRLGIMLGLLFQSRKPGYDRARDELMRTHQLRGPADEAYIDLVARGIAHFQGLAPAYPRRPRPAELSRLQSPTLLVLAGHSEMNKPRHEVQSAAQYAPVVSTRIIPRVGHGLIRQAPGRTATLTRGFLTT